MLLTRTKFDYGPLHEPQESSSIKQDYRLRLRIGKTYVNCEHLPEKFGFINNAPSYLSIYGAGHFESKIRKERRE